MADGKKKKKKKSGVMQENFGVVIQCISLRSGKQSADTAFELA